MPLPSQVQLARTTEKISDLISRGLVVDSPDIGVRKQQDGRISLYLKLQPKPNAVVSAPTPTKVVIAQDSESVIVSTGSATVPYDQGNPVAGSTPGNVAGLQILVDDSGAGHPTVFSVEIKIDGVLISFGGLTSIALPLPTIESIDVAADPGQSFTAASDILFTVHAEGDPSLLDLGNFVIILYQNL